METKLKDFIKIYNGVLPPKVCSDLIDNFERKSEHHEMSKVGVSEGTVNDYRQAIEMNCSIEADHDVKWKFLTSTLNKVAMDYQKLFINDMEKLGINHIPESNVLEEWRMHRYDKGEHFYKPHVDSENTSSCSRMLAFLFYLNTVPKGGETVFTDNLDGITCPAVQGRLLVFPTWMGFPHEAKPVIEGTKYMIKTFIHYPGELEIE